VQLLLLLLGFRAATTAGWDYCSLLQITATTVGRLSLPFLAVFLALLRFWFFLC
jgi:hypothetical protein